MKTIVTTTCKNINWYIRNLEKHTPINIKNGLNNTIGSALLKSALYDS